MNLYKQQFGLGFSILYNYVNIFPRTTSQVVALINCYMTQPLVWSMMLDVYSLYYSPLPREADSGLEELTKTSSGLGLGINKRGIMLAIWVNSCHVSKFNF